MAPILSLLRSMAERGIERKATYYYGARGAGTCASRRSCRAGGRLPGFRYVPALSEPADGDDWHGETGLITDVVKRLEAPQGRPRLRLRAAADGRGGDAAARQLGVPEKRIYYDKFTTTGDPQQ